MDEIEGCLLVCKSWNSVTSQAFWDKIIVVLNTPSRIGQFYENLRDYPTFCNQIRNLKYHDHYMFSWGKTASGLDYCFQYILKKTSGSLKILH